VIDIVGEGGGSLVLYWGKFGGFFSVVVVVGGVVGGVGLVAEL